MAQSLISDLQAYCSGPGHGAGRPYRAFGLALMTLLCMQLQPVSADSGESHSCASSQQKRSSILAARPITGCKYLTFCEQVVLPCAQMQHLSAGLYRVRQFPLPQPCSPQQPLLPRQVLHTIISQCS